MRPVARVHHHQRLVPHINPIHKSGRWRVPRQTAEALYDAATGTITIAVDVDAPYHHLFGHEFTHHLEQSDGYDAMRGFVVQQLQQRGDYDAARQVLSDTYQTNDTAVLERELVADYAKNVLFADEATVRYFVRSQSGLGGRILNWITDTLAKLGGQNSEAAAQLRRARDLWAAAMQESSHSGSAVAAQGQPAQYSIKPGSEARSVMERLARGESVSAEEIYAIPEVQQAINQSYGMKETNTINTPERQALRQRVLKNLLNMGSAAFDSDGSVAYNGDVRQDRRIDIVIGPPAAGKSSRFVDPLSARYQSRVIDSDIAKEMLPEFNGGLGAGIVHEESSRLSREWLLEALSRGDNVVYLTIGANYNKMSELVGLFKESGYIVNVHLNDLPTNKALGRALNRYFEDGRYVDPSIVVNAGDGSAQTYQQLRQKEGLLDGYSHVSNDVPRGQKPIVYESTEPASLWDAPELYRKGYGSVAGNDEGVRGSAQSGQLTKAPGQGEVAYSLRSDPLDAMLASYGLSGTTTARVLTKTTERTPPLSVRAAEFGRSMIRQFSDAGNEIVRIGRISKDSGLYQNYDWARRSRASPSTARIAHKPIHKSRRRRVPLPARLDGLFVLKLRRTHERPPFGYGYDRANQSPLVRMVGAGCAL